LFVTGCVEYIDDGCKDGRVFTLTVDSVWSVRVETVAFGVRMQPGSHLALLSYKAAGSCNDNRAEHLLDFQVTFQQSNQTIDSF
jgi:hypothetical protein